MGSARSLNTRDISKKVCHVFLHFQNLCNLALEKNIKLFRTPTQEEKLSIVQRNIKQFILISVSSLL